MLPRRLRRQKPKKKSKHNVKRVGLFLPSFSKKVNVSYTIKINHSDQPSAAGLATAGYWIGAAAFSSVLGFLAF